MAIECAKCPTYVCRQGIRDKSPDDCPMRGDFPDYRALYSDQKRKVAVVSAFIEGEGYRRWTRLEEVAVFASRLGCSSIGIAFCSDMGPVAARCASLLRPRGVQVVLPQGGDCDPLGQAAAFNEAGTGLNAIAGMCPGHDALFIRASRALVTSLVVRDTFLRHNPVGALYGSEGYFRDALYRAHRRASPGEFRGAPPELLDAAAREVAREGRGRWTRVEEVMEVAYRLEASRIGLVFCHGLRWEAQVLNKVLEANGFQVVSVGCKAGAVPKEELGIPDAKKVRPGQPEMICNPLAQAELLNREKVHLSILFGQCVGHDSATMDSLEAPAICLVAKDRVLAHNTVAALYGPGLS